MAVIATATPAMTLSYTLTDTQNDRSISESSNIGLTTYTFSGGTGVGAIDAGVSITGSLPSGEKTDYYMSGIDKTVLNGNIALNFLRAGGATYDPGADRPFNRIRGVIVKNTWTHPSGYIPSDFGLNEYPYLTIAATGDRGFSGLFNGESGMVKLMPDSAWMFTDSVGVSAGASTSPQDQLTLIDSGSGVPYELSIVGTTGDYGGPSVTCRWVCN